MKLSPLRVAICTIVIAVVGVGAFARANAEDASGYCREAAHRATAAYGLPEGLLLAIGTVESGRRDPATGQVHPWPWSVNAGGDALIFPNETAAISWVRNAQAHGIASIDVGCFQVNLFYHPLAFASIEDAFDPAHNGDYAARLLSRLHAMTGDWQKAVGLYHSRTPALAASYQQLVARVSHTTNPEITRLEKLQLAWRATLEVDPQTVPGDETTLGELRVAWGSTLGNHRRLVSAAFSERLPGPRLASSVPTWPRRKSRSSTLVAGLASSIASSRRIGRDVGAK